MTEVLATTPGLFPLPDPAKDDLADLKGHQKHDLITGEEGEAITAVYDDARGEVIERQREAGLDRIVEGQLRWDDMLVHPLCVHDAVEPRALVRYYDNNNFYREPAVVDDLDFDGDIARDLEAAAAHTDRLQAVLPGPYTLSELAIDEHYGDDAAFQAAIGEFLAEELAAAPAHETVFLLEPSLATDSPTDDAAERASAAIDAVAGATDAEVVVHTYWDSPAEQAYAYLLDADIDGVGVDLINAREDAVHVLTEYGLPETVALGVVDGQNTRVESADRIRERVEWFQGQLPPVLEADRLYVTPNTGTFYLPVSKFEAKLAALGDAVATKEVPA